MENELLFRIAGKGDIPDLLPLYAQLDGDSSPSMDPSRAEELWDIMEGYPDYQVHVVESGGTIVGTFSLLVVVALSHRGVPGALVEAVVVDEKCRNRGVGEAMMRRAMEIARAKGCYKLVLSSGIQREDAHRFYENMGFERHGISFMANLEVADA